MGNSLPVLLPPLPTLAYVRPHTSAPTWRNGAQKGTVLPLREFFDIYGRILGDRSKGLEQAGRLLKSIKTTAH